MMKLKFDALNIRFQVSGFRFQVSGFRFQVSGFGLWALGFGLWALGFGLWVLGFGFWALGFGFLKNKFIGYSIFFPISFLTPNSYLLFLLNLASTARSLTLYFSKKHPLKSV
ncbi:hypothetical protein [Geminocystis sp.]|uniref:hypothetical protein n=1 Tax=Geminocystis sp. TaxID=2664100 RepID=UPI0035930DCF